jgi:hypothetical protein
MECVMGSYFARIRMPQSDAGLLDLVRSLVPRGTDSEKTLMAVEMLSGYKGETVEKAKVKDIIAEALDTYVARIEWPHGWRKADWISFRQTP